MPEICSEHSGICARIDNITKQTDMNTQDIKTLSDAVIKLTILVEEAQKQPKEYTVDKRPFWDIDTKKYMIKLGFIFSVILVSALVGVNLLTQSRVLENVK